MGGIMRHGRSPAEGSGATMDFPETRWSLIARLADQPEQAAVVVELYADSVGRYLRAKFANDHPATRIDDVIQEVLIYLLEHPELLARAKPGEMASGTTSKFRFFLMTLAFNAARNALRRQQHVREVNAAIGEEGETLAEALAVAEHPTAEHIREMDRAWAESLLAAAWKDLHAWAGDGTLEAEIPRILQANLVEGVNLRDLCAELKMPLATCHRRLARGRTYLQKAITDRLRQAGEIAPDADGAGACDLLLEALRK
jgi:DNA-directed RNA polymerase specialized sigma24 family protein